MLSSFVQFSPVGDRNLKQEAISYLLRFFRPRTAEDLEIMCQRYLDCSDYLSAKHLCEAVLDLMRDRLGLLQTQVTLNPFAIQYRILVQQCEYSELLHLYDSFCRMRENIAQMLGQDVSESPTMRSSELQVTDNAEAMLVESPSMLEISMAESSQLGQRTARLSSASRVPIRQPAFSSESESGSEYDVSKPKTKWVRKSARLMRFQIK